jgi:hypothetical protein
MVTWIIGFVHNVKKNRRGKMDYGNMIDGHCFTNLDEYQNERWPHKFCVAPQVGDCIRSRSSGKELKVVRITHIQTEFNGEPELVIELHKMVGG